MRLMVAVREAVVKRRNFTKIQRLVHRYTSAFDVTTPVCIPRFKAISYVSDYMRDTYLSDESAVVASFELRSPTFAVRRAKFASCVVFGLRPSALKEGIV